MSMEIVKRLAEQAGDDVEHTLQSDMDFLERFAELVASEAGEAMRERCAKVCDEISNTIYDQRMIAAIDCAAAIRQMED